MWKIPELRNKILYTLGMLVLFRLVGVIPAPGVDAATGVQRVPLRDLPILQLVNMMTGSNFANMTIMAMGITPYINASIIMQLLTIAIPALERMQRDEEGGGREKIARITRYVTVGLAAVQAIGLVAGLGYIKSGWFNYAAGGHQHGRRLCPGHVDRRTHHREGRRQWHQHADHGRYPVQPAQRHRVWLHQCQRRAAPAAAG